MNKKILIIYTGGTIGMYHLKNKTPLVPMKFNQFKSILKTNINYSNIDFISLPKVIDSSDINIKYWNKLLKIIKNNYITYDGFIILHGSDTLAYTSAILHNSIKKLNKPIILTGSQLPLIYQNSDAKNNLNKSINFILKQNYKGIYICFGNKIFNGFNTYKNHINSFDAFKSLENVKLIPKSKKNKKIKIKKLKQKKILFIYLYPNIDIELFNLKKADIIIISSYGNGNMPINLAKKIVKLKKTIILISECKYGTIKLGTYSSSNILTKSNNIYTISNTTIENIISNIYTNKL